ncbi:MAG TPA: ISAs1 family transposase [Polyangiaceae bacterium]|nr:ISAs1 family transposase [Polyangiaceae bacterium]
MPDAGAKRGAYALPVKGNQPGLSAAIERALASRPARQATTTDRHGDRLDVRTLTLVDAAGLRWPGAAQVGRLERIRNVAGDVTSESTLLVMSLPATAANAEALLGHVRGHWGIEHRLHFVRDVVFGEDACRVRSDHAPHVFAAVRNAALHLLRGAGHERIASATRYVAARAAEALGLLGLAPASN